MLTFINKLFRGKRRTIMRNVRETKIAGPITSLPSRETFPGDELTAGVL